MRRFLAPALLLGLVYVSFFGCLALTQSQLPPRVATHFNGRGQPDGWMSRDAHLRSMLWFGLGFPLFVPALIYGSRFLPDRLFNIPNREYWFAPERRAETMNYFLGHSLWFSSMALGFVIGIHFSILQANRLAHVHLSTPGMLALAGAFLAGTGLWAVTMFRHFKRVG